MVSDETLMAGLAAGDAEAATAFVRRFQSRVFGLAMTILADRSAAEEVSQEALFRAWRHAPSYDARRGRVDSWLLTITRNLAIDHLRIRRAEPVDPAQLEGRGAALLRADVDEETGGEVALLRSRLARLPVEQRRAVVLAALFGFTAREISEIEGAPLGTTKTRIRTGLRKLVDWQSGGADPNRRRRWREAADG